jgi:hypothetical protein
VKRIAVASGGIGANGGTGASTNTGTGLSAEAVRERQRAGRAKADIIEYIEVAPSDIALANRLAHEVLGRSIDELPPQTRSVLGGVCALVAEKMKAQGLPRSDIRFTRRELRERMALSNVQIGVHLARLIAMEYVLAHRGGRGTSFVYELLFDGAFDDAGPRLPGLIAVESLRVDASMTANREGEKAGCKGSIRPQNGGSKGDVRPLKSVQNTNNEAAFDDSAVADSGNARRRSATNGAGSYAHTSSLAASPVSR